VIVADDKLETPHIEIQRIREADMGEHSKPSYERLTAVEASPLPKMGQALGSGEQPAVSGIVPSSPAPVREEAAAAAPQVQPARQPAATPAPSGGVISRLLGWFRGTAAPAAPAPQVKPEPAQPQSRGQRRDERGRPSQGGQQQGRQQQQQQRREQSQQQGQKNQQQQAKGNRQGQQQQQQRQPQGAKQEKQDQRQQQPAKTEAQQPQNERKQQQRQEQPRQPRPAQQQPATAAAPPAERPTPAPVADAAKETIKDAAVAAAPVTEVVAGAEALEHEAAETEGSQSRRRRGRRGGRRRRRHDDAAQAGATELAMAGEDHLDLDDEDRNEAAAPAVVAQQFAAGAAAAAAVAVTDHVATEQLSSPAVEPETHVFEPAIVTHVEPAPVPEHVLSAVAPASFNLPALPPIPEKTAVENSSAAEEVEAVQVVPTSPVAAVTIHEQPARQAPVAEPVSAPLATLTADVTASVSHTPEPTPSVEATPVEAAGTTIDFRAQLDTTTQPPLAVSEPSSPVTAPTEVAASQPQHEQTSEAEPAAPASPAQGDLLANAELPHQPSHVVAPEKPVTDADTDEVKKDASHG